MCIGRGGGGGEGGEGVTGKVQKLYMYVCEKGRKEEERRGWEKKRERERG